MAGRLFHYPRGSATPVEDSVLSWFHGEATFPLAVDSAPAGRGFSRHPGLWFAITQNALFPVVWIAVIASESACQFKSGQSRVRHRQQFVDSLGLHWDCRRNSPRTLAQVRPLRHSRPIAVSGGGHGAVMQATESRQGDDLACADRRGSNSTTGRVLP